MAETYQFPDIQDRLRDDLSKVADEALDALEDVVRAFQHPRLGFRFADWLLDTLDAECARREFRSSIPLNLQLADWTPAEVASSLPLSLALFEQTADPLTEAFAITLHKYLVATTIRIVLCREA